MDFAPTLPASSINYTSRPGSLLRTFDRHSLTRIAHKRQSLAVGRPAGHVDGALTSVDIGDDFWFAAADGHQLQVDVLVERMLFRWHVGAEGEERDRAAVGRDVREPVVEGAF